MATQADITSIISAGELPDAKRATRRGLGIGGWGLVALVLISGVGYGIAVWRDSPAAIVGISGDELKPTGYAADLFDGESLSKWRTIAGNWQTTKDDEGATVLAASGGLMSRAVVKEVPGRAPERLEYYRLRISAALRQATAIELSFGIHATGPATETRSILRFEQDQVSLGRQSAKNLPVVPVLPAVQLALDPEKYHELRIERQAAQWRAYVDDRLIGTIPLADDEAPLIRVAVESDSDDKLAYLADILVEELAHP